MLKEMIIEKSKKYSSFLQPFGWFFGAVLIAFASMGGTSAPLLCAVVGAVSPINATASAAGGIITYLVSGKMTEGCVIISALILLSAGKWIMREDSDSKTAAFVTFISMAFSGIVFALVVEGSVANAVTNGLYAAISAVVAYFLTGAFDNLQYVSKITADKKTITSMAVLFVLTVTILCGIELSILNIGIIIASVITFGSCSFFGCYGGVICGVLTTAGVLFSNIELGMQTVFFGIAGLCAGFFQRYSRVTAISVFSGIILMGQLSTGMTDLSFCVQADIILGGIIFMIIPDRFVTMGGRICSGAVKESGKFLGKEMDFAAKSLEEIRKNIMDVMTVFENRQKKQSGVEKVAERVCRKCRNCLDCWEKNYEITNAAFIKIYSNKTDIFPVEVECINKKSIMDEFDRCRNEAAFSKMINTRLSENRNFLFSQMEASEDIVNSLSDRINVNISKSMTATLCRSLERSDIAYNTAIAYYNCENRLIAEVYLPAGEMPDIEYMCSMLSRQLSVGLEYTSPFSNNSETRIRFNQQTYFTADVGQYQLSAKEGDISGDTCGYFTDGLGYGYAFLSDGMGQGSRAAIDSKVTAALFKRLIRLGMSCEGAVKMINSVLLAKSGDESFATLDIAKINLETGGVTLCKSGASPTLIKYGDSVMMFSFASNPVGIIHEVNTTVKECEFAEDDILVLTSDGVPEKAYMYVKEKLIGEELPEVISEKICNYARKITEQEKCDDITAVCVRLRKNSC